MWAAILAILLWPWPWVPRAARAVWARWFSWRNCRCWFRRLAFSCRSSVMWMSCSVVFLPISVLRTTSFSTASLSFAPWFWSLRRCMKKLPLCR